jgi:hypothetical protein
MVLAVQLTLWTGVVKQMPQMVFKAVLDPEIQIKLDSSLKVRKSLKVLDDYHEIVY